MTRNMFFVLAECKMVTFILLFNVKLVLFQLIFVCKQLVLAGWTYGWSFRWQQRKPIIYIGYDRESVIVIEYQRPPQS